MTGWTLVSFVTLQAAHLVIKPITHDGSTELIY